VAARAGDGAALCLCAGAAQPVSEVLSLLALLVQEYKY
jgi:hypothetical protein